MVYFFMILVCFFSVNVLAQDGYGTWEYMQTTEASLSVYYQQKRVYTGSTTKKKDRYLTQVKIYKKGRIIKDRFLEKDGSFRYDISINYSDSTAVSFNAIDSAKATYLFTPSGKINYYVLDRNSQIHLIYTYDKADRLIRCKDCLNPLNDHNWCTYYLYFYNEKGNLTKVENYILASQKPTKDKVLISYELLSYDKEQRLTKKVRFNPDQNPLIQTFYFYNKKGKLIKKEQEEKNQYRPVKTTYSYAWNQKLRSKRVRYFEDEILIFEVCSRYNAKGLEIKKELKNGKGELQNIFVMRYVF